MGPALPDVGKKTIPATPDASAVTTIAATATITAAAAVPSNNDAIRPREIKAPPTPMPTEKQF